MPYVDKTIIAGDMIFRKKYYTNRYQAKNIIRGKNIAHSSEVQEKKNFKNAFERLWHLLLCNFKAHDLFVTLTYRNDTRPGQEQAKKDIAKFLRKARTAYHSVGKEFKYIWVCEFLNKKIHFHVVLPQIDPAVLSEIWEANGNINVEYTYEHGDFKNLAYYLIKETCKTHKDGIVSARYYNGSKNLTKPRITRKVITKAETFRSVPFPIKGYYVLDDEVETGVNEYGFGFISYALKKIKSNS